MANLNPFALYSMAGFSLIDGKAPWVAFFNTEDSAEEILILFPSPKKITLYLFELTLKNAVKPLLVESEVDPLRLPPLVLGA